jgi:hypothetical protein
MTRLPLVRLWVGAALIITAARGDAADTVRGEVVGRPLGEVLAKWSVESGTRLRCGAGLRSQKVTVALPAGLDAGAARNGLAELLQARWATRDGDRVLERHPDVVRRLNDSARLRRAREAAATREQGAAAERALAAALARLDGPAPSPPPGTVPLPHDLLRLVGSLDPAHRAAVTGQPRPMTRIGPALVPDKTPALSAPFGALTPAQQGWVRGFMDGAGWMRDPGPASVHLFHAGGSGLWFSLTWPSGDRGDAQFLPVSAGAALTALWGAPPPASPWAGQGSDLSGLVSRRPGLVAVGWSELDYAETVAALATALRTPVLADYYTGRERLSLRVEMVGARDLVEAVCRAFGCTARWSRGVLLLRTPDWEDRDRREIPQPMLDAWGRQRQAAHPHPLGREALAQIAGTLGPEQWECLAAFRTRTAPQVSLEFEATVARQEAPLLRLLQALTPAARDSLSGAGLRVSALTGGAGSAAREIIVRLAGWLPGGPSGSWWLRLDDAATPTLVIADAQGRDVLRQPTLLPPRRTEPRPSGTPAPP